MVAKTVASCLHMVISTTGDVLADVLYLYGNLFIIKKAVWYSHSFFYYVL